MAAIQCSARVPRSVDHERIWGTVSLEVMRIGRQTIVLLTSPGRVQGEVSLAALHFNEVELAKFIQKLILGG